MSATHSFSPSVILAAPAARARRGGLAAWLARLSAGLRARPEAGPVEAAGRQIRQDIGLPPGPSHDERVWGVGGLMWR